MTTTITVTGIVATQPKFTVTSKNVPVASFRLAVSERRYDVASKSWVNGDTSWLTVSAFRYLAENVSRSVQKGERVVVTGRLRVREWQSAEKSGLDVELDAEALGHDLNWGSSVFTRAVREAAVAVGSERAIAPADRTNETGAPAAVDASGWAMPGGAQGAGPNPFEASPPEGFSSVTEPEAVLDATPF